MTRPDGSLGWKNVLFAGIDSRASATSTICRDRRRPQEHGQLALPGLQLLLDLAQGVGVAHGVVRHAEQARQHGLVQEEGVESAQAGRRVRG